jgi:hypothetical protein
MNLFVTETFLYFLEKGFRRFLCKYNILTNDLHPNRKTRKQI